MAFETGRPRLTITAVLLAAIGGAVYVLAPLARRSVRRAPGRGEEELWHTLEVLGDRVEELADRVRVLEARSPIGRRGLLRRG